MSQLEFDDERTLDHDSHETIRADDSNTRLDGTEIIPKLDFQRGASLEDDREIEEYTCSSRYPDFSSGSTWVGQAQLPTPHSAT